MRRSPRSELLVRIEGSLEKKQDFSPVPARNFFVSIIILMIGFCVSRELRLDRPWSQRRPVVR